MKPWPPARPSAAPAFPVAPPAQNRALSPAAAPRCGRLLRSTRATRLRRSGTAAHNSRARAFRPACRSRSGSGSRTGARRGRAPRSADRTARAGRPRSAAGGGPRRGGRPAGASSRPRPESSPASTSSAIRGPPPRRRGGNSRADRPRSRRRGRGRSERGAAMRVRLVRRRQRKDRGRNHPLAEVVDPLEAAAPGRGGDAPGPEQPFQRALGVAPFPPAAAASCLLEVRGRHRPVAARSGRGRPQLRRGARRRRRGCAPAGFAALGPRHPPAQQGVRASGSSEASCAQYSNRRRARFGPRPRGRAGRGRRAEPREGRQIMGAGEHVDAVDLVQRQPIEIAAERRPARHRPARRAEALRGKRDPARGGEGKELSDRRVIPAAEQKRRRRSSPSLLSRPRARSGGNGRDSLFRGSPSARRLRCHSHDGASSPPPR